MKKILFAILILGAITVFGGRAISTCFWNVCGTSSAWQCANGINGDVATTELTSKSPAAFLTTSSQANVLGNLTGKGLSVTVSMTSTGNPVFNFWGMGTSMNPCGTPANVRLYFTSNPNKFNLTDSQNNETQYWWSNPINATLTKDMNLVISDVFDPSHWSNPNGHWGNDPTYTAGFYNTLANVRQIGVSFGGGCFFDIGVGVKKGTGTAIFHINSINVQ